eukprot:6261504-Prymnesium_polylepis.1
MPRTKSDHVKPVFKPSQRQPREERAGEAGQGLNEKYLEALEFKHHYYRARNTLRNKGRRKMQDLKMEQQPQ